MTNTSARILLVEDDLVLAGIYKARMEMDGFTILHCKDGQEALEKFKEFNPNLIILDLMTPRVSGFDVIDTVRNDVSGAQPKILVLSAMGQSENKERAKSLGADEYLVKSQVVLDDVMTTINKLMGAADAKAAK